MGKNIVRILSSPKATLELYVAWSQGSWVQVMWEVLEPLSDGSSLAHVGLTVTNHNLSPEIRGYEDSLAEKLWLVAICLVRHRSWSMLWHSEAGSTKVSYAYTHMSYCISCQSCKASHTQEHRLYVCVATQSQPTKNTRATCLPGSPWLAGWSDQP